MLSLQQRDCRKRWWALVGYEISDERIESAVAACRDAASPISDKRGTAAYRKKVVGVLVRERSRLRNRVKGPHRCQNFILKPI